MRYVILLLAGLFSLSAWAQDPFRSAPEPAPPKAVQRPRPAPPIQQEDIVTPPATVTTVSPPQSAPPPAPSLVGQWSGMVFVGCDWPLTWPTKLELTVAYAGPDQYSVRASAGMVNLSGYIQGKRVSFEGYILLDKHVYQGMATSPTEMSGTVTNRLGDGPCLWSVRKLG